MTPKMDPALRWGTRSQFFWALIAEKMVGAVFAREANGSQLDRSMTRPLLAIGR